MPHVSHAVSITNDGHGSRSDISNRSSSNPITQVIKVTLPTPTISLYDHSFICCHSYIHTRIHTFIHTIIHSSHTSEASHMQLNASQRSVLRHKAAIASFKHEQRPTRVQRPAHKGLKATSCQTEPGEKMQMSPERPSPSLPRSRQGHLNLLVRS